MNRGNQVLTSYGMGTIGWVNEDEVRVVLDDGSVKIVDRADVDVLDYMADRDLTDSKEVWQALNFIHGLRQRGDEPGTMLAEVLEPLAAAYRTLKVDKKASA